MHTNTNKLLHAHTLINFHPHTDPINAHTQTRTHILSLCVIKLKHTHTHTLSLINHTTHTQILSLWSIIPRTHTLSLSDQPSHTHTFSLWPNIPPPPPTLCNWLHSPPPHQLITAIWWAVYLWPAGITPSTSGEACSSLQWLLKMISVWVSYFSSVHVIWSSLLQSNAVQFKLVSQHPWTPISTVWVQGNPLTCCLRKVKDI